jgi:hypothetical protein
MNRNKSLLSMTKQKRKLLDQKEPEKKRKFLNLKLKFQKNVKEKKIGSIKLAQNLKAVNLLPKENGVRIVSQPIAL